MVGFEITKFKNVKMYFEAKSKTQSLIHYCEPFCEPGKYAHQRTFYQRTFYCGIFMFPMSSNCQLYDLPKITTDLMLAM